MKTNLTNNETAWLYCNSGETQANDRWSRLNMEKAGVTWQGNPVRAKRSGILVLLKAQPIPSHTDNNNWTSEADALGEWGVVWGL